MNAGIADADTRRWMLAAVLNGWAEPALLAAYQAERQPITEQVSRFAFKMSEDYPGRQRREISGQIEQDFGPAGDAVRTTVVGQQARDLYIQQQCCGGLNFGCYLYGSSPIVAYDGAPHPVYSMGYVCFLDSARLPRAARMAPRAPLASAMCWVRI